jgi:hypothetical protein
METIRPHASTAPECAVDGFRDADGESLKTPCETCGRVRFDEQMHVIGLHAEVDDPEAVAASGGERATDGREHATVTKGR